MTIQQLKNKISNHDIYYGWNIVVYNTSCIVRDKIYMQLQDEVLYKISNIWIIIF